MSQRRDAAIRQRQALLEARQDRKAARELKEKSAADALESTKVADAERRVTVSIANINRMQCK
jgi:hypothetical protein